MCGCVSVVCLTVCVWRLSVCAIDCLCVRVVECLSGGLFDGLFVWMSTRLIVCLCDCMRALPDYARD